MSKFTGVVDKIGSTKTRNGGYAYRITVDGTNYGCGFDAPDCAEGDTVEFEAEKKGQYWNITKGTLKKVSANSGGDSGSSQVSNSDRQTLIVRQSCIGHAIQLMEGGNISVDEVIMKADDLVDYVFNGLPEYLSAEKEARMMEEMANAPGKTDKDPLED